ncbi:MAG: phosphate signaling complex protein PhoU [Candidatus Scalindua sp.]|jgi:phosphate transport system protein|nr:phosphate signaling complex protein PhoU [Candidatus Scalindua sp.]MBT5305909.1 phosphate signaling complex protein PhoU [Candidatus Scalindua sp.]MBT6046597.1 phosphate signaling complex protein PhoU [Candidatus Scalindua sp.]MBT6226732.1 phosphate signaling complex protein PhoU [Candidatus Scalindua sp.]MBT6562275.1 phosphate signaling complex protein PhoU [Candidatus Scalindua sp.]
MGRKTFRENMKALEKEIIVQGEMVNEALYRSVDALRNLDITKAEKVIKDDQLINRKRWDIEEKCINLLATQQPVATDLRELIAVLSISTDLERMGDHAEGIAKIAIMHGDNPLIKPLVDIPRMAEKASDMLMRSIDAFINRDAETAKAICEEDDEVDALYDQTYRELLTFMTEDPTKITRATYLLWAAHNLERIADRVTNICERIVFLITGTMDEIKVSNY